ncbi:hypothetical protein BDFB_014107, partial [Asbolus verrucosus]
KTGSIDKKASRGRPKKITPEVVEEVYQKILLCDFVPRANYCKWLLHNRNDDILDLTSFTDETWFHLEGHVKSQNMRTWSIENPH